MRNFKKSAGIYVLIGMGSLAALFVLIFDRYTYYDYQVGRCDGSGGQLVAELIGRFDYERPRTRGGPYNLKIKLMTGAVAEEANVQQLTLIAISPGRHPELGDKDLRFRKVEREDGVVLFAVDDLKIPYEDYRLTGEVVTDRKAAGEGSEFSCILQRKRWGEWRVPLIDVLMSV